MVRSHPFFGPSFFRGHFTRFVSLSTLSSGKKNAFAATCNDYLEWLCPKSSQVLLEALLDALELEKTNTTGKSKFLLL